MYLTYIMQFCIFKTVCMGLKVIFVSSVQQEEEASNDKICFFVFCCIV
jgi:hypothetical protein